MVEILHSLKDTILKPLDAHISIVFTGEKRALREAMEKAVVCSENLLVFIYIKQLMPLSYSFTTVLCLTL
jgi:hypothetical protein